MFVYIVKPDVPNSGGCAIVAARNKNEAYRLVNENNQKYAEEYIGLLASKSVHLEADCEEPKVLLDEIYFED